MALKARYIGKTYGRGYDKDFVYLEYEYRGKRYEVYENRAKGNEPLAWQHRNAQIEIDTAIERAERAAQNAGKITETADEALQRFFDYIDGNEKAFD